MKYENRNVKINNSFNKKNSSKFERSATELDNNKNNSNALNINYKNNFYQQKKNNNLEKNNKKRNNRNFDLSNPIEEEIENITENLKLFKRNNSEIDNNTLIYQTENDISVIEKLLKEDNLLYNFNDQITFLDIVCFILKKNTKRFQENEILKIFFLKIEKLVHMFKPLNVSLNDMMGKLVGHIKYEKKLKDNILFKEGDKGDKFYIILKGEVGILIQQERVISCTHMEFLKCLMVLYLYQEKSMLNKILSINRENLKYDDRCFITLMEIFKFYHFYKDYAIIKKPYRDIIEFNRVETKISKFIRKKNDFSPEQCFQTLDLSNLLAEELYNYYCRIIENIHIFFWTDINFKNNKKGKSSNNYVINNPTNLQELGAYIQFHEDDERKFKSEEFFEKIYHINEISNNYILECDVNDYIQRLSFEEIIKLIRKDLKNFIVKMFEEKLYFKYYNYIEVNKLKDGNIFGELALINPSKKRTATVIIREDCHLGILNKEAYDESIKNAQDKLRIRNLLFFTNGPIFNGIANNFFLNNYLFRFKKKSYKSGEILFHRGEIRTKIIFIINGELQLSGKMTLKKLTEIIVYLNGEKLLDDEGLSKNYCRENFQFKKFFEESKKIFKFYTLKDKEIAGLDDMTENNIYLFDCRCISLTPTEVYELEYKIFKEASEDFSVKKNNDDYVSMKKEILANRLYGQRDSIARNEYNRIKRDFLNFNFENNKNEEKTKIINYSIKTLNNFFPLNNTTFNTKMLSFFDENQSTNNNNSNNYFNSQFPPLNTTRNSYLDLKNKSKTDSYDHNDIQSKNNSKKEKKLLDLNNLQKEKSIILLKINQENKNNDKNINLIKSSDNYKISGILSFKKNNIKNNNFSYSLKKQKLIHSFHAKIANARIKKLKKNITPDSKALMREFTKKYIEPIKIPFHKKKFIFNNQKIFEPLLNNKISDKNKKIYLTLKKEENNKENSIKDKIKYYNNNEIYTDNSDSSKRNKINKLSKVKNNIIDKYRSQKIEENYKDIFFIDCLCLDKWEERTNKHLFKGKAKIRGKK